MMGVLTLLSLLFITPTNNPTYLEKYLESKGYDLVEDKQYLLISQYSCTSCSKHAYELVQKLCEYDNLIIISGRESSCSSQPNGLTWIYDPEYEFDLLPYNFSNISVITLLDKKLKVQSFGLKNLNDLEQSLNL
jgi:hypothetical protein